MMMRGVPPGRKAARLRSSFAALVLGVFSAGCEDASRSPSAAGSVPLDAPPGVRDLDAADPAVADAVRSARDKLATSMDSAPAWGHLGMVLLAHDFFSEAATCLREAARLDPRDPRWPYLQALGLLEGAPDARAALPALRTAAALATAEPAPRLKLGEVLLEQGLLDEAEREFRAALALDAAKARAELGLGRVAYLRGDLKTAKDHLVRSAGAAPRVRATRALLAEICFREGDRESAEGQRLLMDGLPDTHHWPDPYFAQVLQRWVGALANVERANDLFGRGRREEAVQLLEETTRLRPDALLAHLALGRFHLQANQPVEAESALRRAVDLAPEAFEAHHELGTALERQGKTREAAECFEATLRIKPGYAPAHFHLGRCRLQQGDQRGALEALEATVRFKPDYAEAQRALGHLLAQGGRYDEAAVHLRRAVRLRPEDQKARLLLEEVSRQLKQERK